MKKNLLCVIGLILGCSIQLLLKLNFGHPWKCTFNKLQQKFMFPDQMVSNWLWDKEKYRYCIKFNIAVPKTILNPFNQNKFSKHRPSGPMLSISRNVRLSVCPSVRLSVSPSVCLFTFEVPFNGLFAPTSRCRMSNILRDSESLGKSNGKKWSQIWTYLFENCLKSTQKKSFFLHFFRSSSVFGLF